MPRSLIALAMSAALILVPAGPAEAASSDWIDPDLAPGSPAVALVDEQLAPGEWFDEWFTHAELEWLKVHGLTPSALEVLQRRMTPPPPPARTPSSGGGGTAAPAPRSASAPAPVEGWRSLVAAYFAPGDVDRALRILWCESKGNPGATNPRSGAAGLFQHLPRYWSERAAAAGWAGADIYEPEANVAVAAWLAYNGGWGHWSCR